MGFNGITVTNLTGEHYRFVKMVFTHKFIHFLRESLAIGFQVSGVRCQVSGIARPET